MVNMEIVSNLASPPPPYSRLDEDSTGTQETLKKSTSSEHSLTDTNKDESRVTIKLAECTKKQTKRRTCVMNTFLCGCSLKSGCITVAVLYALYLVFFTAIAISFFIITYVEKERDSFSSIWGFNVALFECCMATFIIVFISIGVHKERACRLHVAKWLMVVDLTLNLLEEIHIAILVNYVGLIVHLIMQVIPMYFVFVVHSYEVELISKKEKTKIDCAPIAIELQK